jgi:hypothetical protein
VVTHCSALPLPPTIVLFLEICRSKRRFIFWETIILGFFGVGEDASPLEGDAKPLPLCRVYAISDVRPAPLMGLRSSTAALALPRCYPQCTNILLQSPMFLPFFTGV